LPYTYSVPRIGGDTDHTDGIYGIGYTAQFGNGISATISFEDNGQVTNGRGHLVANMSMPEFALGAMAFDNKGQQAPDVVGNLRIEQAWGYAQVSAALHDASGGYYGAANSTLNGHPSDKYGFAVTGGFTLNDILGFKGDQFGLQACYAEGGTGYCTRALGAWQMYSSGNNAGFGWTTDGVYDTGTNVELTTVWGITGFAQHLWSTKWRTSVYGGYTEIASATGRWVRARSGTRIRILTSVSTCSGRTSTPPTRAQPSSRRTALARPDHTRSTIRTSSA